jgi:hypothetical protein
MRKQHTPFQQTAVKVRVEAWISCILAENNVIIER